MKFSIQTENDQTMKILDKCAEKFSNSVVDPRMDNGPKTYFFDSAHKDKIIQALEKYHGFEGAVIKEVPVFEKLTVKKRAFKYRNSLGRRYNKTDAKYLAVSFNTSRYGKYSAGLAWKTPVSEDVAIRRAEEYLSTPIDEAYYNKIKDDLFHNPVEWKEAKQNYKCRGDCLTDAKFLEIAEVKGTTQLNLLCGS